MKIEEVSVDAIKPYARNPRVNAGAVDSVAESIRRFGFKQPLVIEKDGTIVVGHTRYAAARKLGLTTVPCVRASELSKKDIRAYRILDNKLNELAYWDFDALKAELSELDYDFDGFEVDLPVYSFDGDGEDDRSNIAQIKQDIEESGNVAPIEYAVYVEVASEAEQKKLYDSLTEKGYTAKCLRL